MKLIFFCCTYFFIFNVWAKIDILDPGSYRTSSLRGIEDNSEWYAVCQNGELFSIKKTHFKIVKTDEKKDEDPYLNVVPSQKGVVFLIRGLKLKEGDIPAHFFKKEDVREVKIGSTLVLEKKLNTKILAKGTKVSYAGNTLGLQPDEKERLSSVEEYTIEVKTEFGTAVLPKSGPQERPYALLFVGDLNGDGLPDILVNLNQDKVLDARLFLSEKKSGKFTLNEVATMPFFGD